MMQISQEQIDNLNTLVGILGECLFDAADERAHVGLQDVIDDAEDICDCLAAALDQIGITQLVGIDLMEISHKHLQRLREILNDLKKCLDDAQDDYSHENLWEGINNIETVYRRLSDQLEEIEAGGE